MLESYMRSTLEKSERRQQFGVMTGFDPDADIKERLIANYESMLHNNSFKFIPKGNSPSPHKIMRGGDSLSPTHKSKHGTKQDETDPILRDNSLDESMTLQKKDGGESSESKKSFKQAAAKLPALPNIAIQKEEKS